MAGSAVIGALRVDLGLNSAQFNTGLKQSQGALRAFSTNLSKGMASSVASLAALAGSFLSVGAAINIAKTAMQQFGRIADQAKAAGVDSEFFQGIAYQAKLSGLEIDGVAGALATFAKNSGLAAEGKGRMVGALQALNPELLKNIQLATSQEQRIRLAADAINEAKSAAEAAAIATAMFGDAGIQLVAAFKGGADEMDRMLQKAKEIGIVVARDVIARADELGDKFDTATMIVDLKLKQAFINLAPYLVDLVGLTADWLRSLSLVLDQTKAIEDRQFVRPLQNQLAEIYNQRFALQEKIAELEKAGGGMGLAAGWQLADAKAQLEALTNQASALLDRITELQGRGTTPPPGGAGVTAPPMINANLLGDAGLDLGLGPLLDVEIADKFGEIVNGAGAAVVALEPLNLGIKTVGEGLSVVGEIGESIADSLASGFANVAEAALTGGNAMKALASELGNIGKQLLSSGLNLFFKAILGGGIGGGGLFTGNFNIGGMPLYAGGTNSAASGFALVGENGPELVNFAGGEQVIPNHELGSLGHGGGNLVVTTISEVRNGNLVPVMTQVSGQVAGQMIKQQSPIAVGNAQRNNRGG